jgi:monoamine oxidase
VTLTRRGFLARGAAAAVATTMARPRSTSAQTPQRIAVIGAGLAGLCAAFELLHAFEGGTSISWSTEAKGAYAWFKPGQLPLLPPRADRAEGRVHFAGDHTSALPGWMQGALASAQRVVEEIQNA